MSSPVADFLERFRRAEAENTPVDVLIEDHEGWGLALAEAPEAFAELVTRAVERSTGPAADLIAGSFASAACDGFGVILVADDRFMTWLGGSDPLSAVVRGIGIGRSHVSVVTHDHTGRPVAIAAGGLASVGRWPLDQVVRQALETGTAAYAVIAFSPGESARRRVATAFGFTPSEARLVSELAVTGDLQKAADRIGVAYDTARKLVATAMEKAGSSRQTDLVRGVLRVSAGDLATPGDVERLFADLFGLNPRQAQLARLIALGLTREGAARTLNISAHRAKTDLKAIFVSCGVTTAVDLTRIVSEVDALAGLSTACDVEINLGQASDEPLRLVRRRWGPGQIAVADYGPQDAEPVVIFHATPHGRAISKRLIFALQAQGFRPLTFDRAGFGLSDWIEGDPYVVSARDLENILDAFSMESVLLLSRAASLSVLAAAASLPHRVRGGVLVTASLPAPLEPGRTGMFGMVRTVFSDHPALAEGFARLVTRRTNSATIERTIRSGVAHSLIDQAALDDPEEMREMIRASRQAGMGIKGFVSEMISTTLPLGLADARNWSILVGDCDPLQAFDSKTEAYWRGMMPGANVVRIPDGGRFLHITHPNEIAGALRKCAPG